MKLTAWEQFPYSVRKAWMIMRLTTLIILITTLHLSAKTSGQTITLSSDGISIHQFFRQLEKQTGFSFLMKGNFDQTIDVHVTNEPLEKVLDDVLKPLSLSYKIEEKIVYIIKITPDLSRGVISPSSSIPSVDIHGRVTDSLGNPLVGASVTVKGSRRGASTDVNGDFALRVPNENLSLIISFTGYLSREINLNGRKTIEISLVRSNSALDQVQIIGYGTTSKRLNPGDISTVSENIIGEQPVSDPLAAMEGRVSGLYISQQTGIPGGTYNVVLRGLNSIASGKNPFYIIDGVPFTSTSIGSYELTNITSSGSPFNNLNPSDIESITVLKDADATAIYGSRGANGVILITTKKGKAGKTNVDVNLNSGSGKVSHFMTLLNTPQYLDMRHEAFRNDNQTPGVYDYDLTAWDTTRYTNWQKSLLGGSSHIGNAQITISGGNDGTQFLLGGTYHRETTVFPGSFADTKISSYFNLNHVSSDGKFSVLFSASFLSDHNNLPESDLTSFALTLPPDAPPMKDSSGKINWGPVFFDNPLRYLLQKYAVDASTIFGNSVIGYKILPNIQAKINLGYTQTNMNETVEYPISSFLPVFNIHTGSADFSNSSIRTWIAEPQLIWNKNLAGNQIELLAGTTFQQDLRQGATLYAAGYNSDALLGNLAAATSITTGQLQPPYDLLYRYTAVFGRIHFERNGKYIFNFTGRRDGSSRFGPGKQFANFGAFGAAWIFSKEHVFNDHMHFLSFGKLRGSFGTTGNDQIGNYQYLSNWQPTTYTYSGASGLYPVNLANANYAWETNQKLEGGLDLGFLKDAILFALSYYQNHSTNQLVGFALPNITGFSTVQANLPAVVKNTGWEFEMNATIIKSKHFSWTTSLNMSIPHNVLVSYPNIAGSPYADVYQVGKSLFVKKLFHFTGVNPQSGLYEFGVSQGGNSSFNPTYPDDLQANKEVTQSYFGGFSNTFAFKNWKLVVFFQYVKQTGYNYMYAYFSTPGFLGNQPSLVLNRWQKPGDQKNVQRFTQDYSSDAYTAFNNSQNYGDNILSDASFIRLKNVSLSYRLPSSLTEKIHVKSGRLFFQGQNLITFTHFMGMDPENQSTGNLPPLRVLTAGIQFTL